MARKSIKEIENEDNKDNNSSEDKLDKLNGLFKSLEKDYGNQVIVSYDEEKKNDYKIQRFSLASLGLSYILGGGIPKGRIIESYGSPSHGKSLVSLLIAKDVQDQGGFVVYMDFEFGFDFEFARKIGVDLSKNKFKLIRANIGEDGFKIIEELAKTKQVSLIIWDSVNSAKTGKEENGDYGDANMGTNARMYSSAMKKIVGILHQTDTTLLLISQLRLKLGLVFGDPRSVGVGEAIKYYASIRYEVKRKEYITKNDEVIGSTIIIKNVKNKTAPALRECELDIYQSDDKVYIDLEKELVNFAVTYGIIEKGGTWYSYKEHKLGQGKDNAVLFLRENIEIQNEIRKLVEQAFYCMNKNKDEVENLTKQETLDNIT